MAAGLNQSDLAGVLGWSQSKVSRLERAQRGVNRDDVDAWLNAVGAEAADRNRIRDLVHYSAYSHHVTVRLSRDAFVAVQDILGGKRGAALDQLASSAIVYFHKHRGDEGGLVSGVEPGPRPHGPSPAHRSTR
jgi:transcriptional regulator with XRE-family HTH domain